MNQGLDFWNSGGLESKLVSNDIFEDKIVEVRGAEKRKSMDERFS